jgi:hypothetical protein
MAASRSGITDTRPVIAKKLSSHFQIPLAASSADGIEDIDQEFMATVGPPRPMSFKESTPNLTPAQTRPKDPLSPCQFGDTCISTQLTIPQQQWRLQSSVLARHSVWFKQFIEQQMDDSNKTIENYTFVIMETDGRVKLVSQDRSLSASTASSAREDASLKVENEVETAAYKASVNVYDQLFKAFDGFPPAVSNADIRSTTTEAEQLAKMAQDLEYLDLISSHIGNTLLQHRQALYKAILADPPRYLLLSLALENDFIYTESLIHMIGAYPCWPWPTPRSSLPTSTTALVTQKSRKLDHEVLLTERELLLLTILTSCGTPFSSEISSPFDTWFVAQLFRDTITSVLRSHDPSKPSLRRGSLFRKLKRGGSAYMAFEDVWKMVRRVMPSAVEELDENLGILKDKASEVVEALARNELSLDVEENKVGWLTCAEIRRDDILWRADGLREC